MHGLAKAIMQALNRRIRRGRWHHPALHVLDHHVEAEFPERRRIRLLRRAFGAGHGEDAFLACERGTSFGYGNLVVDMRSLVQMRETGCPVVFDATHSVQLPGANGTSSGGQREFVEPLARAAVSVGVAGLFMETHPDPASALSDGPNAIPLAALAGLVDTLGRFAETAASIHRDGLVNRTNPVL
jgi:3-deoxy-D-manno-octulosonic acid (KDO) 8-phosphate synthase